MSQELTVKQTKFIKGVAQGKTKRQSAIDAGYKGTPETISVVASETLRKPNVQEALQKEMVRQGITIEKIIKPIKDGLDAEKVHIVGSGDQAKAEITPDHSIRLKASSMAQTLLGANKPKEPVGDTFIQIYNDMRQKYND